MPELSKQELVEQLDCKGTRTSAAKCSPPTSPARPDLTFGQIFRIEMQTRAADKTWYSGTKQIQWRLKTTKWQRHGGILASRPAVPDSILGVLYIFQIQCCQDLLTLHCLEGGQCKELNS